MSALSLADIARRRRERERGYRPRLVVDDGLYAADSVAGEVPRSPWVDPFSALGRTVRSAP